METMPPQKQTCKVLINNYKNNGQKELTGSINIDLKKLSTIYNSV